MSDKVILKPGDICEIVIHEDLSWPELEFDEAGKCCKVGKGSIRTKGSWERYAGCKVILDHTDSSGKKFSVNCLEDGNSFSWVTARELKFVREGTPEDTMRFDEVRAANNAKCISLPDIIAGWLAEDKVNISTITMNFLLKKIGVNSGIDKHGEFYILLSRFYHYSPLIDAIIKGEKDPVFPTPDLSYMWKLSEKVSGFRTECDSIRSKLSL